MKTGEEGGAEGERGGVALNAERREQKQPGSLRYARMNQASLQKMTSLRKQNHPPK